MHHGLIRIVHLRQSPAGVTLLAAGLLAALARSDFGAGLTSPSDDGGSEEFDEF